MTYQESGTAKNTQKAYDKIVKAFRARKKGATIADVSAATGLSLYAVKELVPRAADEYSGRLEVTESGEILYSFPRGFSSRYKGAGPFLRKFAAGLGRAFVKTGTTLFKIWIMVMLVGYFLLFMAIALASVFVSVAGNSSNNRSRRSDSGGAHISMGIFNLIFRLWFYSELTRTESPARYGKSAPPSKPLHKAIFSFVFGDGDPNAGWPETEKKTVIAYVRENRGVISLPEFMALTGRKPGDAESAVTAFCAEFNGSPEATDDGTVVYRFDEILLGAESPVPAPDGRSAGFRNSGGLPLHFKALESFSSNKGKMNWWFCLINGVNLLFGGYFLYNAATVGQVTERTSFIYRLVYTFIRNFTAGEVNPPPLIMAVLGVVPLAFSVLFWLIPLVRNYFRQRRNEKIRFENFRKLSFSRIWNSPLSVTKADLDSPSAQAPANLGAARDRVIKEMGSYTVPDVSIDNSRNEVYGFAELEREKQALTKYRVSVNAEDSALGKTVFDSDALAGDAD